MSESASQRMIGQPKIANLRLQSLDGGRRFPSPLINLPGTIACRLNLELAQELHETWIVSPLFLDPAMTTSRIAGR